MARKDYQAGVELAVLGWLRPVDRVSSIGAPARLGPDPAGCVRWDVAGPGQGPNVETHPNEFDVGSAPGGKGASLASGVEVIVGESVCGAGGLDGVIGAVGEDVGSGPAGDGDGDGDGVRSRTVGVGVPTGTAGEGDAVAVAGVDWHGWATGDAGVTGRRVGSAGSGLGLPVGRGLGPCAVGREGFGGSAVGTPGLTGGRGALRTGDGDAGSAVTGVPAYVAAKARTLAT